MSYFSPNSLNNVSVTNNGTFLGQTGWFNCGLTGPINIATGEKVVIDGGSITISNNDLPVSNVYLGNLSNLDAKQSDILSNVITTNTYLQTMTNAISNSEYQCNITNGSITIYNTDLIALGGTVQNGNVRVDIKNNELAVINSNIDLLAGTVTSGNVRVDIKNNELAVINSNIDLLAGTVTSGNVRVDIKNNELVVVNSNIDLLAGTVTSGNVRVDIKNNELVVVNSNIDLLAGTVLNGNVKVDIQDATIAATQSGTWSARVQDGSGNNINSTSSALNVYNTNNITGFATSANQSTEISHLSNIQSYTSNLNNSIFTTATFPSSQVAVATSRTMPLQYGCIKFNYTANVASASYSAFIDTTNVSNDSATMLPSSTNVSNIVREGNLSYIPKGASVTIGLRHASDGANNHILCPAAVDTSIISSNAYSIGTVSTSSSAYQTTQCGTWYYPNGVPRYIGFYNNTPSGSISNVKVIISFTY